MTVLSLLFFSSEKLLCQKIVSLIPFVNHKTKKYGYADSTGKIVIDTVFQNAFPFHKGYAFVVQNHKMGIINSLGQSVTGFIYIPDSPTFVSDSIVVLRGKDYYGFVKINGQTLTDFKYSGVGIFMEGLCPIHMRTSLHGFINSNGEEIIPPMYESIGEFAEGVCAVKLKGKYFFINKENRQVIPGVYDKVFEYDSFCNGVCRVHNAGRTYFIDKLGNEIIVDEDTYSENIRQRQKESVRQYYAEDNDAPTPHYDSINSFGGESPYQGFVYKNYYNKDGQLVFSNSYGRMSGFKEGLAIMSQDSTLSGVNSQGNNVEMYRGVYNKVGAIDKTGKVVIDFKYGEIDKFNNGIALVKKSIGNRTYIVLGYIDRKGREYWIN